MNSNAGQPYQGSAVLWLTGLSGAGKTTIAELVAAELRQRHRLVCLLDGDVLRRGLNRDLGFSDADRTENIRRAAEVARLMAEAGHTVLAAFISPLRAQRALARAIVAPLRFFEVHIDTPLALAESRDPKGLYRRARAGGLSQFTGIDAPYEPPLGPELRIDGAALSAGQAAERVLALLA